MNNININININVLSPDDCDIEPYDHTYLAMDSMAARCERFLAGGYLRDCSIDPCDMLAEPKTDLPGTVRFSVPGRPGTGFAAAKGFTAKLEHVPDGEDHDRWYYVIHGNTMPSRKLLYAIGCVYDRLHCRWLCMDAGVLVPYIDSVG